VINMTPELGMPLLKPWWRITYEATRVIFQYGDDVIVCEGKGAAVIVPRIVPLLDGGHSVEDIVAQLGAHTAPFVAKLLELFVTRGMLIEGPPVPAAATPAARGTFHSRTMRQRSPACASASWVRRLPRPKRRAV
jgi:hypothetical protein